MNNQKEKHMNIERSEKYIYERVMKHKNVRADCKMMHGEE